MANKMLIDTSHPEETRVVVLRGNRVEEFDFESASKKQLRGNIYLAKVTRVEPSLQAAFVDYGGNRHGFLAFSEIHPDYYQIPVSDRQALIEEDAKTQSEDEDEDSRSPRRSRRFRRGDRDRNGRRAEKRRDDETISGAPDGNPPAEAGSQFEDAAASVTQPEFGQADEGEIAAQASNQIPAEFFPPEEDFGRAPAAVPENRAEDDSALSESGSADPSLSREESAAHGSADSNENRPFAPENLDVWNADFQPDETSSGTPTNAGAELQGDRGADAGSRDSDHRPSDRRPSDAEEDGEDEDEHIEQLGGDAMEELPSRPQRYRKQYKIQEVIKRRQVLLVQVVKEERGNKGAALTTYLSLAGRYSVLMPNTARGGGISRKITDSEDRQRLKSIAQELEVPEGMGVILRTAGASRTKAEVKRDFEYLMRMWEIVRETTLKSTAPTLVYEEGSLIKRSIRDLFNKDIDEIIVSGDTGYREAKDFMGLLMPSHVRNVRPYRDPQPMFAKYGAESQLDAMFSNQVTLKSGGYIVINQTEALVAIDVNSGRSTREHNIEDTAVRTNLEAADEVTRQLRLRDLAGLIVIDFIDMEEGRNNRAVERRLKEALRNDRARIQVGRISHFGLLEMSRQRIRTGVLEGSTVTCPHCAGAGTLRSTSSIALHVLRVLEDALIKSASHDILVKTTSPVALYILNQKRAHLSDLEARFGVFATVAVDDSLTGAVYYALERGEPASGVAAPAPVFEPASFTEPQPETVYEDAEDDIEAGFPDDADQADGESAEGAVSASGSEFQGETDADGRRKRRRRRRRGRGGDREGSGIAANAPQPPDDALDAIAKLGGLQTPFHAEAAHGHESEASPQTETAIEASVEAEDLPAAPSSSETQLSLDSADGQAGAKSADGAESPEAEAQDAAPRRKPRRGTRAAKETAEPGAERPELNLALDATAEISAAEISAAEVSAEGGQDPAAPAPRARRTTKARTPRRAIALEPADETSSPSAAEAVAKADPQVPEIGAQDASAAAPAEPEAPAPRIASFDVEALSQPAPTTEAAKAPPVAEESTRPKRSGWWQRAKASLKG
ncbi:ribonuclease E/G [Methylocapsa palsarum]|uniref:Ribonuclease E n=1 Tax=Methylocapsa palsarum TaxID=1612308 RepID=A0A1I3ZTJ4_9HYPH|nr:ribonuclease E/G [Methylocapsa palsarum]SFK46966.1 ribonuclease E [Methylocapsa palsarum]